MPFIHDAIHVSNGARTDDFVLRPIREADAELDHAAVMESREFLRVWEQSSWPEDDFTVEANREDLRKLEQRHEANQSFTYTVMNLSETQCLGCVYVFSIDAGMFTRAEICAIDGTNWSDYDAAVYFWIRKSRLADALDRKLLDLLGSWLAHDWRFDNFLLITNEQFEQQVETIENAGLPLAFRVSDPKAEGDFLAYGVRKSG